MRTPRPLAALVLAVVSFFSLRPAAPAAPETAAPPLVVIKVDDLVADKGQLPAGWRRFADFALERKLKVGIGIICNSLDGDRPEYFAALKGLQATGLVEFWNHGYNHRKWKDDAGKELQEFRGTDDAFQLEHFAKGQRLAKEKLGLALPGFGAPYNAIDAATARALASDPDLKVWLYGPAEPGEFKGFVARRVGAVNIERATGIPDFDAFVAGYEANPGKTYFVIQGHPRNWSDEGYADFAKIIDYLTARGTTFVFPSELAGAVRARADAPKS